jgi:hypothetical protein
VTLHRVTCSRHLRLLAVEAFASLPCFLALNLPMKYSVRQEPHRLLKPFWLKQFVVDETNLQSVDHSVENSKEVLQQSGWLADIITNECFLICAISCKSVVEESLALIEVSSAHTPSKSILRKRPGVTLSRDDMLVFHSISNHAIRIVYELVVRRHSMDHRFQSESAQSRIAGLLAKPILEQSCANVRWIGKLESTNKVRSTWLLCFVYVLQEAPEALIYDFVQSCCDPKVCLCSNIRYRNVYLLSREAFMFP